MITDRTCRQCGITFRGGPRAWYCPSCRSERAAEASRRCKKNGPQRPLGSTDICQVCGKPYVVCGGAQKYCPDCQRDAVKAADREQGLSYYGANKDAYNPKRNAKRRKPETIPCAECRKLFARGGTKKKYCSPECRRAAANRRWREMYHKTKNPQG